MAKPAVSPTLPPSNSTGWYRRSLPRMGMTPHQSLVRRLLTCRTHVASGYLASLVLATATFGCPAGAERRHSELPLLTTDNREAEAEFQEAQALLQEGKDDEAEAALERFLERYPNDPLSALATLELGQLFLRSGELARARHAFESIEAHSDSAVREQVEFYQGVLLHREGRHRQALQLLRPFVGRTVDPAQSTMLLNAVASASLELGDPIEALGALNELLHVVSDPGAQEETLIRVDAILDAASPSEVLRATEVLPQVGAVWERVASQGVLVAYREGDIERVRSLISELEKSGVEITGELQEVALRAERPEEADAGVVGALLPLSGPGRLVGQLALQALLLASGSPNAPSSSLPRVVFRDVAGGPDMVREAVDELVSLHRAIAIVGPLSPSRVEVAAERAADLGVPLLSLAPGASQSQSENTLLRLLPTAEEETSALLRAAQSRGLRRIACLYPQNGYGEAMNQAMAVSAQRAGVEMVASIPYQPDITSFGSVVGRLARFRFDTLFLPDRARSVALIAPALRAARLRAALPDSTIARDERRIQILLPSVADTRTLLLGDSERYLQGALASVPFLPEDQRPEPTGFVQRFRDRFGRAPELFAASSYDAYRLIVQATEQGAGDRPALLRSLKGVEARTVGASSGFTEGGGPRNPTRLWVVSESQLQPFE